MKYAFFGTPEFAAIILEKLINAGLPPALVVCNPDRPIGRKQTLTAPPTKVLAAKHGITVAQPNILDSRFYFLLSGYDFAVVAAYAKILPKEIINAFPKGMIGVHPSLLPKYRGATPIQSVILAGEEMTGTTLFLLDEKVDHGPVIAQRELTMPIPPFLKGVSEGRGISLGEEKSLPAETAVLPLQKGETYETLLKQLADLSGDLLVETLPKFANGKIQPKEQDHDQATFTKKFTGEDGFVDPVILSEAESDSAKLKNLGGEAAIKIDRMIRALNPEPGVYTISNPQKRGLRVKLLEAEIKNGKLVLKKIQEEGGKPKLLPG